MKLKKAYRVYFVQKESPKRMDYRFGYQRTPESALLFQLGQWICGSNGKLKKRFLGGFKTRDEAEALASRYNEALLRDCPWEHYEIIK